MGIHMKAAGGKERVRAAVFCRSMAANASAQGPGGLS